MLRALNEEWGEPHLAELQGQREPVGELQQPRQPAQLVEVEDDHLIEHQDLVQRVPALELRVAQLK